jgi:hypothetical protein
MTDLNALIMTIENHIENLGNFKDIGDIIDSYRGNDWLSYIDPFTTGLSRNKIYLSSNIEVFILSWKAGYETLPHDHSKNGCWLKQLRGRLTETFYSKELERLNSKDVNQGQFSFISNDMGYHSIKNDTEESSFSIHIYSPPMHNTKYFSNLD